MGNTKIIVVHAKQIIKSSVIFLIGLALITFLILMFLPKNNTDKKSSGLYLPGKYFSQIILNNKPVRVEVSVDENKILAVKLNNINKCQKVFYPLFQPTMETLSREIIQYQTVDIPTTCNNSITEKILLNAVDNALQQAKAY